MKSVLASRHHLSRELLHKGTIYQNQKERRVKCEDRQFQILSINSLNKNGNSKICCREIINSEGSFNHLVN